METVTAPSFSSSNISDEFNMSLFHKVNSHVRDERFAELLELIDIDGERRKPVNLMNDPVLNVIISANKTELAVKLIQKVTSSSLLLDENIYGDTALHIAAIKGNFHVAYELLSRELKLVMAGREQQFMKAIAAIVENFIVAKALLPRESRLMEAIEAVEGNITELKALQTESQLVEAAREPQLVEAIAAVEGNITVIEELRLTESQLMVVRRVRPLLKAIVAIEKNITVVEALLQKESQLMEAAREPQLVEAIAAVKRNNTVAKALLHSKAAKAVNKKGETAVHKAAMYGHRRMFWFLQLRGDMARYRTNDGSSVLHCAIMGNNPKLALDIAEEFPELILSRDEAGWTPLQLIVTIPSFLRSPFVSGCLKRFLYKVIPIKVEDSVKDTIARADEEAGRPVDRDRSTWKYVRSKFRCQYMELIGSWVLSHVLKILMLVYRPVKYLEREKKRCMAAMKLVEYLAEEIKFDFYAKGYSREPNPTVFDAMRSHSNHQYTRRDDILKYILNEADRLPSRWMEPPLIIAAGTSFDFYGKGYSREPNPTIFDAMRSHSDLQYIRRDDDKMLKYILNEGDRLPSRWMEPPLIIAAELGLDDFVHKILQVCPQSAIYLDSKGRNVMQVAIQSGHEKVVRVISEMLQGSNPILPSCLCSMLDSKSRNTILHLAAENSPPEEGDPLQLYHELVWFEMVKKIVPRGLVYSRNKEEKTAHELFTNNHKEMLEECQKKLVDLGKLCAGLVAAVVFASSFSIPTHKDNQSDKLAYTIFTHAYLIGFGCATTALVLFLSLVVTPYQERYFRRAIPRHFLLACLSFALTLVGFLVSFACKFVLQIYGGQKMQNMQLVKLLLELLLFPLVCIVILLFSGAKLVPSFSPYWE